MTVKKVKEYVKDNNLKECNNSPIVTYQKNYLAAYLRHMYNIPYEDIKNILGYKNHSSVIHCIKKHLDLMWSKDKKYLELTDYVSSLFPISKERLEIDYVTGYRVELNCSDRITLEIHRRHTGQKYMNRVIQKLLDDKIKELKDIYL